MIEWGFLRTLLLCVLSGALRLVECAAGGRLCDRAEGTNNCGESKPCCVFVCALACKLPFFRVASCLALESGLLQPVGCNSFVTVKCA
jgi:hypothetical protein